MTESIKAIGLDEEKLLLIIEETMNNSAHQETRKEINYEKKFHEKPTKKSRVYELIKFMGIFVFLSLNYGENLLGKSLFASR